MRLINYLLKLNKLQNIYYSQSHNEASEGPGQEGVVAPGQVELLLPVDILNQLPDSINGHSFILLFVVLTAHVASLPPLAFDDAP